MSSSLSSKSVLILNPRAGGGADLSDVIRWGEARLGGQVVVTQRAGEALIAARRASVEGAESVISAGGDGTLHEIINGLAPDFRPAVGILPLGTGNDFARSLGVPRSPADAMTALESASATAVDLVRIDGPEPRHIINSATGGFGVRVEEKVGARAKSLLGAFAYLLAAARSASQAQDHRAVITIDGGETIRIETPNVVIANGRFVAGGYEVAPKAALRDGFFDVVLVTAQTLAERLKVAAEVGLGSHLDSDEIIFRQARRVEVESDPPMPFSLDGETSPGRQRIVFEIVPAALRVLAPAAAPQR